MSMAKTFKLGPFWDVDFAAGRTGSGEERFKIEVARRRMVEPKPSPTNSR